MAPVSIERARADRGDPPIERWPGRPTELDDVEDACGHPDDWFPPAWRVKAHTNAWKAFWQARERRNPKSYFRNFNWNQILVFGEYGAGKTALANFYAYQYWQLGHPVFSNGPTLFGWRLEDEELYTAFTQTAKHRLPYCAVVIIDEGHAQLGGGMANSVAFRVFMVASANIRKLRIKLIIISGQDRRIAGPVRDYCVEAWRPVPLEFQRDGSEPRNVAPANNPENFVIAWDVWDGYPYRQTDLVDADPSTGPKGFGPPACTMQADGEAVRNAFLLTDTFQLVDVQSAFLTDKDSVRDDLAGGSRSDGVQYTKEQSAVLAAVRTLYNGGWDSSYLRAGDIGRLAKLDPAVVGKAVGTLFNVQNVQRKGYPVDVLMAEFDSKYMGGE